MAETTHKREGLKPCPFCGASDIVLVVEQIAGCPECDDNCYIRCNQCFAGGPNYEDEQRAQNAWNERQWTENQDTDWQWQNIKQLVKQNERLAAENAYLRRPRDGCTCPKTAIGFVQVASHDCPIHGSND